MNGKFIGRSSMGFISGRTYDIKSEVKKIRKGSFPFCRDMMCICIYDKNSKAWCPYQSLEAVMNNWEFKF